MSITVPGIRLAKAWLAVAQASGREDIPQLDRTICVEQYPNGVRLVATDRTILLTGWVPDSHSEANEPAPDLDEVPYATAVAFDPFGRGAGLLKHLLRLAKDDDSESKYDFDVRVHLNVPWQPDETSDAQLDGFQALAVSIEHPDHERIQLEVYGGDYVNWRPILAAWQSQRCRALALTAKMAARVGRAANVFSDGTPIRMRFGGVDKAIAVEFGADNVTVSGLVMPFRYNWAKGEYDTPPSGDTDGGPAVEPEP